MRVRCLTQSENAALVVLLLFPALRANLHGDRFTFNNRTHTHTQKKGWVDMKQHYSLEMWMNVGIMF